VAGDDRDGPGDAGEDRRDVGEAGTLVGLEDVRYDSRRSVIRMILFENPIQRDWFDWSNALVGIVGLGLTLWAVWQATGAKRAATEAKDAVYRRNAADAMMEVVRIAEQLNTSVLYERPVEGGIQLRELVFRIPRDREEFANLLGLDADRLRHVESSCKRWADFLVQGEFPLSTAEKQYRFKETLNTVQELSAIHGRLRRMLDREEE
jgi:hypothetical protein